MIDSLEVFFLKLTFLFSYDSFAQACLFIEIVSYLSDAVKGLDLLSISVNIINCIHKEIISDASFIG